MAGKPGRSGRKRQGAEAKVYFNSRIDPELRDQLQSEADKNGRTLSREIELRLRGTFIPSSPTSDAGRVFAFLLEEAARLTTIGDKNWRNDENLYFAFMEAVRELLKIALVRTAPWRRRSEWSEIDHPLFKKPEDLGKAAVFQITNSLANADSLAAVADLTPDDPRREYANAAQFIGSRAKNWASTYQSRAEYEAKLRDDPEYQALMREQEEQLAEMGKQMREDMDRDRHPERSARLRDWIKRMEAVHAKYSEEDKS